MGLINEKQKLANDNLENISGGAIWELPCENCGKKAPGRIIRETGLCRECWLAEKGSRHRISEEISTTASKSEKRIADNENI